MSKTWLISVAGVVAALALQGCGAGGGGNLPASDASRTVSIGIEVTPAAAPPTIWISPTGTGSVLPGAPMVVATLPLPIALAPAEGEDQGEGGDGTSRARYGHSGRTSKMSVVYHNAYQPAAVGNMMPGLVLSAFKATLTGQRSSDLQLEVSAGAAPVPALDRRSTVQWVVFDGPAKDAIGAAFVWLDGNRIVDADLLFNVSYDWQSGAGQSRLSQLRLRREIVRLIAAMLADGHNLALDDEDAPVETWRGGRR